MSDKEPIEIKMESGRLRKYFQTLGTIEGAEVSSACADDRCLSFSISLNYGGAGQGFGGIKLGNDDKDIDTVPVQDFIERINKLMGTANWNEMKGKKVYAIFEENDYSSYVRGLKSLDGDFFFIDNWVKDHYPDVIKKDVPLVVNKKVDLHYSRLGDVE
jgi:hypothetical protein